MTAERLTFSAGYVIAAVLPFPGACLLYSAATGERPIHNTAAAGLVILWFTWIALLTMLFASLSRLVDE